MNWNSNARLWTYNLGNTVPERGRKLGQLQLIVFVVWFRKYSPREGTETFCCLPPFFSILSYLGNTVPERGRKPMHDFLLSTYFHDLGNTVPERGRKLWLFMYELSLCDLGNTVPERGRKPDFTISSISSSLFRKYSPREGTETIKLFYSKVFFDTFRKYSPREGTETKQTSSV